jgi:hypothetical protein
MIRRLLCAKTYKRLLNRTPHYAAPVELVGDGPDKLAAIVPAVADWDQDGRDDLIVGRSDGSVVWHRNTSAAGAEPSLAAAEILVAAGVSASVKIDADGEYQSPQTPTQRIRLCVCDYNNDGQLDLLIGDSWMLSAQRSVIKRSPEEAAARVIALAKERAVCDEWRTMREVPADETESGRSIREVKVAALAETCVALWRQANPAPKAYSRHGSVWLFIRQAE